MSTEQLETEQKPVHITEVFQYQMEEWSWSKVATAAIFAATFSVLATVATNDDRNWLKALSVTAGLGATYVGLIASDRAYGRQVRVRDIKDMSDQGFTQELYNTMVDPDRERPVLEPKKEKELWFPKRLYNIFDLIEPQNRTSIPHVLILGNTGAGKTFILEQLLKRSNAKNKIYVSPTKEEDEMNVPGMRYVGCGLAPHQNGNYPAIKRFFEESTVDVKARTKMTKQQKLLVGFTECALDEIPAIALEIDWSDWFLRIVSMARKQGFRLWVPTTGDQVKTLGIEGRGDMRENLKYLRLGDAVEPHLQALVAAKKYPQALLDWYERVTDQGYRVFVFEDKVGILPTFEVEGHVAEPFIGYQVTKLSDGYRQVSTPDGGYEMLPPLNPFEILPSETLYEPSPLTEPADTVTETTENPRETKFLNRSDAEVDLTGLTPEEIRQRTEWQRLLEEGQWKSKILFAHGYGAKKYKQGCTIWEKYALPDKL
jgi:hypothetical protein